MAFPWNLNNDTKVRNAHIQDNFDSIADGTYGFFTVGEATEKTIASGVITADKSHHLIDTENDDPTDDLDTINGASLVDGYILVLRPANSGRTVVVKDGTGNIFLAGSADFSMDTTRDTILLLYSGSSWLELSRSDNGA